MTARLPVRVLGSVDAEVECRRILLSPKDFAYFGIEGSGASVGDRTDGERTIDDIVALLEAEYEAPAGPIRVETLAFQDAPGAAGLVAELGPLPTEA